MGVNVVGTSSALARADHTHALLTAAPVTTLSASTANTVGTAATLARSDHIHAVSTAAPNAAITATAVLGAGTAATLARSDHVHAVSTAAPNAAITATAVLGTGTAATLARSDHVHAVSTAAPLTIVPNQANAVGTSASLARADHVHQVVTATAVAIGVANSGGTVSTTTLAKSDHVHEGVHSIKALATGTQRYGDITLLQGAGITVADSGAGSITITARPLQLHISYTSLGSSGTIVELTSNVAPTPWQGFTAFVYRGSVFNQRLPTRFAIIYSLSSSLATFEARIQDLTNDTTIATTPTFATQGNYIYLDTTVFTNVPTGNATFELQFRRVAGSKNSAVFNICAFYLEY
jgi:hypothetical protein